MKRLMLALVSDKIRNLNLRRWYRHLLFTRLKAVIRGTEVLEQDLSKWVMGLIQNSMNIVMVNHLTARLL